MTRIIGARVQPAAAYNAGGFDVAVQVSTNCADRTPQSLRSLCTNRDHRPGGDADDRSTMAVYSDTADTLLRKAARQRLDRLDGGDGSAMLPMSGTTARRLTSLSVNGNSVAFTIETIRGIEYATVQRVPGSTEAAYRPYWCGISND